MALSDVCRMSPSTRFAYGSAQPQTTRPSQSMTAMDQGQEHVKRVARWFSDTTFGDMEIWYMEIWDLGFGDLGFEDLRAAPWAPG